MALRSTGGVGAGWLVGLSLVVGCSASSTGPEPQRPALEPSSEPGQLRTFAFEALDGSVVTSASLRGRMTYVALAASYDTASHAQVLFLRSVVRRHVPRINALLLVLEPAHHRPMVEAFAGALELSFPVAMAEPEGFADRGPFPGLHHVPSVVLLDRDGREVWRRIGLTKREQLEQALQAHEGTLPTVRDR